MPFRFFCLWGSPGKNTRVDCHFLLQGIFLNQGLKLCLLCLLRWQTDSLPRSPLGSPLLLTLPFYLFILFLAALCLHCPACASSSCGAQVSHCGGFSGCRVRALGSQAWLPPGTWTLPGTGLEPVSPGLAGRLLSTAPLGKSSDDSINS